MADSLALPYSIETTNPVPVVKTYGPWPSAAAARAGVKPGVRHDGLTVMITGVGEYWWLAADLSDAGLVAKTTGSGPSGGVSQAYVDAADQNLQDQLNDHAQDIAQVEQDVIDVQGEVDVVEGRVGTLEANASKYLNLQTGNTEATALNGNFFVGPVDFFFLSEDAVFRVLNDGGQFCIHRTDNPNQQQAGFFLGDTALRLYGSEGFTIYINDEPLQVGGETYDPYDVSTAKANSVIADYASQGGPVTEPDEQYFGQCFIDDNSSPGDEFKYECTPSRPASAGGSTVWKWRRYTETGV